MECAAIERQLRSDFADPRRGVGAAWLFGSVARGTAGPASDVESRAPSPAARELGVSGRELLLQKLAFIGSCVLLAFAGTGRAKLSAGGGD